MKWDRGTEWLCVCGRLLCSYQCGVVLHTSRSYKMDPKALFEFRLGSPEERLKPDGEAPVVSESLIVEMDHTQLSSLFTKLDRIQRQLDGLSSK